jgi:protease-4
MKPFWRSFWASTLALAIMGIVTVIVLVIMVSSMIGDDPFVHKDKTVLSMKLNVVAELSSAEFNFGMGDPSVEYTLGIKEIKQTLNYAKSDDKIEGILLDMSNLSAGMASVEEIRNALLDFKESGKYLIAYAENYTHKSYYIGTVADEIYVFPEGMVDFRGLGAELMFFKGMIDKLGVDVQVIRGSNNKFKSAVEPFMLDSMSDANREQTMTYINAMWNQMLVGISETRGISIPQLNMIADSVYVRNAKTAVEYKLVDATKYEDEIFTILCEKSNVKSIEDLNLLDFAKYAYHTVKKVDNKVKDEDKNVAVIYAVGGIESGKGNRTTIGSETIAKAIRDARTDDKIKAIVLRVNSPGGSALASDVIWREMMLAKEVKPVVVSMGDLAASGGYYIACGADWIFAQPNTITGSIGVFGVIPNFGPMLEDKLGITTSIVETNEHSVSLSVLNGLSEEERSMVQQGVDDIYMDFTTKVANGRGKTQAEIDSIGQGRVWAGSDAINIGLVDELGGIDEAINYAAELAKIKKGDINTKSYPEYKTPFFVEMLVNEEMMQKDDKKSFVQQEYLKLMETMQTVATMRGMQVRLPYQITIE